MAYDVTLVEVDASIGGPFKIGITGFPNVPWNYLLMSYWLCLPNTQVDGGCSLNVEYIGYIDAAFSGTNYNLKLNYLPPGFAQPITAFFDAAYIAPVANVRVNVMVSVNCLTQTVQVYINDSPPSLASGGWVSNNEFDGAPPGTIFALDVGSGAISPDRPAFADLWVNATPSFVDLSIEANRRKFINADLSPVYLGASGSTPFGTSPPVYLTIPSGGVPIDILHNYGNGGAFTWGGSLSFQTPGTCHLPLTASLTGVSATAQVGTLSFPTSIWAITSNVQTPSPGAVGDVWANNSYIDFSDPAVRATFENADGSWQDLGYNGATPTGSSPLLYLTVQLQQPPSDILTGYGQGGAQTHWALLDQGTNPVTGQAYPAMSFDACAPLVGNLELTDIEVTATTAIILDNEVTLRWSDDAGASWSNGLLRSLGQAGEYFTAPTWYRLGMSRNRILELSWSGARAEALQGVFVEVTISAT